MKIYIDGEYFEEADAKISVFDHGYCTGMASSKVFGHTMDGFLSCANISTAFFVPLRRSCSVFL